MSPILRAIVRWVMVFADPRKALSWKLIPRYFAHWRKFQAGYNGTLHLKDSYPCLTDWVTSTPYDPHYFYQGAWIARKLAETKPFLHVDVGSSVLTMAVVSAQVPTVFVDYRPLNAKLPNLISVGGSIVRLPFSDASIQSLSSMHVLEHIGLGRYGDPIDPEGAHKAMSELVRVLAPGGQLFLTMPVGRERVCFNAHRVFGPETIPHMLEGVTLRTFSWVDDAGRYHANGTPKEAAANEYACGFFEFEKL